jgi:hypothetical protein
VVTLHVIEYNTDVVALGTELVKARDYKIDWEARFP